MSQSGAERQRAEIFFLVHVQVRGKRTLRRTHQLIRESGIRVSYSTIRRYSSKYHWRLRSEALDQQALARLHDQAIEDAATMLERHAQLARAAQAAGGSALQQLLSSKDRISKMRPADIARFLLLGVHEEREATGHARDRVSAAIEVWGEVIKEVGPLVQRVNAIDDPEERLREFALEFDRIAQAHVSKIADEGDTE